MHLGVRFGISALCTVVAACDGGCGGQRPSVCKGEQGRPAIAVELTADRMPLYDVGLNPFRQRIADNPALHASSDAAVTGLVQQFRDQGMGVAITEWTTPVYFADTRTPRFDVELLADWAPYRKLLGVPIPEWAIPDPAEDGHMAIIDVDANVEYDLFQFCAGDGRTTASWANVIDLPADGVFPHGLSARGSGFALLNGVIWPHELRAGRIEHALLFSYDNTMAGGPVAPATQSDGTSQGPANLPEGARVQLDPSIDVTALGLSAWQQTIARALQEYGMILGDDGGGISLYAVHPFSFASGSGAYDGVLSIESAFLRFPDSFPAERFRVLDWGPQDPQFEEKSEVVHRDRFEE